MFLRQIFIFTVCTTLCGIVLASGAYDLQKYHLDTRQTDTRQSVSLTRFNLTIFKKYRPVTSRQQKQKVDFSCDQTPLRDLSDAEKSVLFDHKALQTFFSPDNTVSLHFDVCNKDNYKLGYRIVCHQMPEPLITLSLESELGTVVRNFSVYDAVCLGCLHCIERDVIQNIPFRSPQLGITIAAFLRFCEKTRVGMPPTIVVLREDSADPHCLLTRTLSAWKNNERNSQLIYKVTSSQEWPPGAVRITIGQQAITGSWPPVTALQNPPPDNDKSYFFKAIRKLFKFTLEAEETEEQTHG